MQTILDILQLENQLVFLPDDVANIIRHLIYLRKKMFTSAQQRDPGDYIRLGF